MEYMHTIGIKRGHSHLTLEQLMKMASSKVINLKKMHIDT